MDHKVYVEFLCLSCGLQGLRTDPKEGNEAEKRDLCPKCGEKLLTMSRQLEPVADAAF